MAFSQTTMVDSILLSKMLKNGYLNLKKYEKTVNNLNVFPVPDGDTGSNMCGTLSGGYDATPEEGMGVGEYLKKYSKACLFSARGNSGIIFAQYIKGFAKYSENFTVFEPNTMRDAWGAAVKSAYASVLKPTEGTILTVMREAGIAAEKENFKTFEDFFSFYLKVMSYSLDHTPDLLPCLREADVVDSGGAGLLYFFGGLSDAINNIYHEPGEEASLSGSKSINVDKNTDNLNEYGYCTDFTIMLNPEYRAEDAFHMGRITEQLKLFGDSLVTFREEDCVKIHVHTKKPGDVLNFAQQYGEFISLKIENMSLQSKNATISNDIKEKEYALVAVANGEGISNYFKELGVDAIIDGGQTNNPPVDAFLEQFNQIKAKNIICLPNNKNIISTAKLAAELSGKENIHIISTEEITEGFAAISVINPADSAENIISDMEYAAKNVTTGIVSMAGKDCTMDGFDIKKGSYIGYSCGKIYSSGRSPEDAAVSLIKSLNKDEEIQVVTLYYGNNVTEESAQGITDELSSLYPFMETGVINGGQSTYEYLISLE